MFYFILMIAYKITISLNQGEIIGKCAPLCPQYCELAGQRPLDSQDCGDWEATRCDCTEDQGA